MDDGTAYIIAFILFIVIGVGFLAFTLNNAENYRSSYPQCQSYKECPEYDGLTENQIKEFLKFHSCDKIMNDLNITDRWFIGSQECRDIQIDVLEKISAKIKP